MMSVRPKPCARLYQNNGKKQGCFSKRPYFKEWSFGCFNIAATCSNNCFTILTWVDTE